VSTAAEQSINSPEFTPHNIRLDDGTLTKPESTQSIETTPWFISARGMLDTVFPGDKSQLRLADLGCLEGGYAVEFARMGFQVLGIEVRESNIAACNYVKSKTHLPKSGGQRTDRDKEPEPPKSSCCLGAMAACTHRIGSSFPRPVISRLTDFRSPAAPSMKRMSPIGAPNQNRQYRLVKSFHR